MNSHEAVKVMLAASADDPDDLETNEARAIEIGEADVYIVALAPYAYADAIKAIHYTRGVMDLPSTVESIDAILSRWQEMKSCRSRSAREYAGKITDEMRAGVLYRDGYRCQHCGGHENLAMDHVVPVSRGGLTVPDNLQVLCKSCNSRKGAR